MKNATKIVAAIIALATALAQVPAVQVAVSSFLTAHTGISAIVAGVAAVLALFHTPSDPTKQ